MSLQEILDAQKKAKEAEASEDRNPSSITQAEIDRIEEEGVPFRFDEITRPEPLKQLYTLVPFKAGRQGMTNRFDDQNFQITWHLEDLIKLIPRSGRGLLEEETMLVPLTAVAMMKPKGGA